MYLMQLNNYSNVQEYYNTMHEFIGTIVVILRTEWLNICEIKTSKIE